MRAWQVRGRGEPREALELADVEPPALGPGLLRVRVAASALGLPDVFMCRGSYVLTPPLPFTPGQELSGLVTEVGEGALARVGDRVMAVSGFFLGHGGFAQEALALDDFAFPIPEAMNDLEAAAFPIPFHTAWTGLVRRAALREGETLLVLGGAGGTGSAAIQLGRVLGARVIATAGTPEKAAFCKALGADVVVDRSSADIAESVREANDGRGADVAFDPVGGEVFNQSMRCINWEGRILVIGFASGAIPELPVNLTLVKNMSVVGVYWGAYRKRDSAVLQQSWQQLLEWFADGALSPHISATYPLEETPAALTSLMERRATGKVVVTIN